MHKKSLEFDVQRSFALKAGKVGTWSYNTNDHTIELSSELLSLFGYDQHKAPNTFTEARKYIYKKDQIKFDQLTRHAASITSSFRIEFRVILKNTRHCWFELVGEPASNQDGTDKTLVGIIQDFTLHKSNLDVIKDISAGVSTGFGSEFYQNMVIKLAKLFRVKYSFIGLLDDANNVKTIAVCCAGKKAENMVYSLEHTPCKLVVGNMACTIPEKVQQKYPRDELLKEMHASCYSGKPIVDSDGKSIGLLVIIGTQPMKSIAYTEEFLSIFAARASAEMQKAKMEENSKEILEYEVKRQTNELNRINKDLESFTYTASHDLSAPLRRINQFSQLLLQEYQADLEDNAVYYLQRIQSASENLHQLVDDILTLSKVNHSNISRVPVSLSNMVINILDEYHLQNPNRAVALEIESDISVECDSHLVHIALDNLLANAWKFTKKVTKPKISFGTKSVDGTPTFYIKDNGAGFDMNKAKELFTAFHRLHSDHEFEGTGIGLATTQRVIDHHGGKIWAEAEENHGATFYFTLSPSNSSQNLPSIQYYH